MSSSRVSARSSVVDPDLARSTILDSFEEVVMDEQPRSLSDFLRSLVPESIPASTSEGPARLFARLLRRD
jgi:hypothetical protein